jgi:cystathionine beta-synthase
LRDLIGRPHGEHATITVGPDDALTTAHNRMRNSAISQLPVIADDDLVGVLTEDDIITHVFGHPELMSATKVRDAMHTRFVRLDKSTSLANIAGFLHHVPYIAVVDDDDGFLGLVTRADVLNCLRKTA